MESPDGAVSVVIPGSSEIRRDLPPVRRIEDRQRLVDLSKNVVLARESDRRIEGGPAGGVSDGQILARRRLTPAGGQNEGQSGKQRQPLDKPKRAHLRL